MTTDKRIPYTPILGYHHEVSAMSRAQRKEEAERLANMPGSLARMFAESVAQFAAGYCNPYEDFLPPSARKRTKPKRDPGHIDKTIDVAGWFNHPGRGSVPGRADLSIDYVEREVSVIRTTGDAKFEAPEPTAKSGQRLKAGKAILADLLFVNGRDRTPVVAEVKITKGQHSDKDPFAALIQALAAVAHLATPCQYERLRHFFRGARFRETDRPRLDAYIMPVGLDLQLTDLQPIFKATKKLSAALVERPEVHPALGRIVCLELKPGRAGPTPERHFAAGKGPS